MRNLFLCEGEGDYQLMKAFMSNVNGWSDDKEPVFPARLKRQLKKGSDELIIASADGCSKLVNSSLKNAINANRDSNPVNPDCYEKIVILIDNDDSTAVGDFINQIENFFSAEGVTYKKIQTGVWIDCSISSQTVGVDICFKFLLLTVPPIGYGALETFLLDSYKKSNPKEAFIVKRSVNFVRNSKWIIKFRLPGTRNYFIKRRQIVKAEYNTFFALRNPECTGSINRDILKGIPWHEYENIQETFKELSKI